MMDYLEQRDKEGNAFSLETELERNEELERIEAEIEDSEDDRAKLLRKAERDAVLRQAIENIPWRKKIDLLGEKRKEIKEGSTAYMYWITDIGALLYDHYSEVIIPGASGNETDRLNWARTYGISECLRRLDWFDPNRGTPLTHFVFSLISKFQWWEYSKENRKAVKEQKVIIGSTDDPIDDKGKTRDFPTKTTTEDNVIDRDNVRRLSEDTITVLVAMIINFKQYFPKKTETVDLPKFKMWFSERLDIMMKNGLVVQNKRETEQAVDFCYYDYYLDEDFSKTGKRDIKLVEKADVKKEIRIPGEKKKNFERDDRLWLPLSVPVGYWKQQFGEAINPGRFTESRKKYREVIGEILYRKGITDKAQIEARRK